LQALVSFVSAAHAEAAIRDKNRQNLGGRYVEVFRF
jgi:hypothetical protein